MTDITLKLGTLHPAQQAIADADSRYKVICCGRRFGKTLLVIDDIAEAVLRGESVGYFVPAYRFLLPAWDAITATLKPLIRNVNKTEKLITFITGGTFEAWTLDDPRAGQSRRHHRVYVDESATVPNLLARFNEAVMPTLLDYGGSAWLLSTPRGHDGFKVLYDRGNDPLYPDWLSFHYTTYDNPHINPENIDAMRRSMTERAYEQEILAEFTSDAGAVFRGVGEVSTAKQSAPIAGHNYIFGVDWGKANDFTVISVIDVDTHVQVDIERFNKISWPVQRERLMVLAAYWQPFRIIAERNSIGDVNIDDLRADGLNVQGFTTTNQSKNQIIESLAGAIERNTVTLLDDHVQTTELKAYQLARLPSGSYRYSAPGGQHDDTVMALAIAWSGVTEAGRRLLFI